MAETPTRVLFLSHSASRNGASILLLAFLRWLKSNSDVQAEVLMASGGVLLPEFRAVAKTHACRNPAFLLRALPRAMALRFQPRLERLFARAFVPGRTYDLIYANTAATGPLLAGHKNRADAVLWHIHELKYGLGRTITSNLRKTSLGTIDRYVAVSESVVAALKESLLVSDEKIDLIHGFVDMPVMNDEERGRVRAQVLRNLGWPEDVFVVGGCGALGWRKGTDLFLHIARSTCNIPEMAKARFLWVGGGDEADLESVRFKHDLELLGLRERCVRVQSTGDVQKYYSVMDVFALTSREDPFPLVMLEAGAMNVPLVCFADSGGGPEFASRGGGIAVPYLDTAALVLQLMVLKADPELRGRLGEQASRLVRTHHTVASQCPKLLASMKRCLEVAR